MAFEAVNSAVVLAETSMKVFVELISLIIPIIFMEDGAFRLSLVKLRRSPMSVEIDGVHDKRFMELSCD